MRSSSSPKQSPISHYTLSDHVRFEIPHALIQNVVNTVKQEYAEAQKNAEIQESKASENQEERAQRFFYEWKVL